VVELPRRGRHPLTPDREIRPFEAPREESLHKPECRPIRTSAHSQRQILAVATRVAWHSYFIAPPADIPRTDPTRDPWVVGCPTMPHRVISSRLPGVFVKTFDPVDLGCGALSRVTADDMSGASGTRRRSGRGQSGDRAGSSGRRPLRRGGRGTGARRDDPATTRAPDQSHLIS
jgi:hypothetical protein